MAREILATPSVQRALEALRRLRGLDAGALDEFLAVPLSGYMSPDPGDRDRSLKAVGLGLKYLAPPRPSAADAKATTDDILNEMSPDELERFATRRVWPARFRNRLGAPRRTVPRPGDNGAPFSLSPLHGCAVLAVASSTAAAGAMCWR
jgi:hypothetical protein